MATVPLGSLGVIRLAVSSLRKGFSTLMKITQEAGYQWQLQVPFMGRYSAGRIESDLGATMLEYEKLVSHPSSATS